MNIDSGLHPKLYRTGTYIAKKNPWYFDFGIKPIILPDIEFLLLQNI